MAQHGDLGPKKWKQEENNELMSFSNMSPATQNTTFPGQSQSDV